MFRKAKKICRNNLFCFSVVTFSVTVIYVAFTVIALLENINQSNIALERLGYQTNSNEGSFESIIKYIFRKVMIRYSSADKPLHFIPKPWEIDDRAPYIDYAVIKYYLETPQVDYKKVAILTVICNSEDVLEYYGHEVAKLNYPHELVSLFLGDSGSRDGTVKMAIRLTRKLKSMHGFKDADVYLMNKNANDNLHISETIQDKKDVHLQGSSRMAAARNCLLEAALRKGDFEYILWLDSDIEEIPHDIIQQMLFAKSDVVTTPCYLWQHNCKKIFDKSSWKVTTGSMSTQSMSTDEKLVLEGEIPDERLYLHQMLSFGRVVPLDGFGGCALMVRAAFFQKGLRFPEKEYESHIDSEGLSKMALAMNFTVVGLPFLDVFHRDSTVY